MSEATKKHGARTFLVVVDDSAEMPAALRYASGRARNSGGRVALLRVIAPAEVQHFAFIGDLMAQEARDEAEKLLGRLATEVRALSGELPVLYVREGEPREALMALIDEEPGISILILAASTAASGPGPLVSALTGRYVGKLRVPVTIVPGNLTSAMIDAVC